MKKRKVVVAAPAPLSEAHVSDIDWEKCFICQKNTTESLTCPANNPILKIRDRGYLSLGNNLEKLKQYDYTLPSGWRVSDLDDGKGIPEVLKRRGAKYHKHGCARQFLPADGIIKELEEKRDKQMQVDSDGVDSSGYSTRSSSQPLKMKDERCFLCLSEATWNKPLHVCATKEMNENVKHCAEAIGDARVKAMLETGGDLVAQEAKYHKMCLNKYYNQKRRLDCTTETEHDTIFCEGMAFADLLIFIQSKLNECKSFVFQMGKLTQMYSSRISYLLGLGTPRLGHTSRLREKILCHRPDLEGVKSGREYILRVKGTSLHANLHFEDEDEDAIGYYRFIHNLRKCVLNQEVKFEGDFASTCEKDSIPAPLLAAVSTLMFGSSEPSECGASTPLLSICQLILTNMKKTMPKGDIVRHSQKREAPLPLYIGLAAYGRSRDKRTIDELHTKGISVSSNRVTCVTSQLCRMVAKRAADEKVVCPSNLRKGLFTVAAYDNIDLKSSSLTGQGEFHGTSISIFQHPVSGDEGEMRIFQTSYSDVAAGGERSVPDLPDFYCVVPDCVLPIQQPNPPTTWNANAASSMILEVPTQWQTEEQWLSHVHSCLTETTDDLNENISHAAYHASRTVSQRNFKSIVAILPLHSAKSSDPSMLKHGVDLIADVTRHLNGGQPIVIGVDQPLYTLGKQIQWNFPEKYGSDKVLFMFGQLHIEQDFLRVLGAFMEGCGWSSIAVNSGMTSIGSADALLKVTHIKRAREAHQVTAAVLHSLLLEAHEHDDPDQEKNLAEWTAEKSKENPTFYFWLQLLNLEILLLTFVKSLRTSDYLLYKACLSQMLPWFFLFDRHNYARWLTIHTIDLQELEYTAPEIHRQFLLGKFTVNATGKKYSAVGIDHRHEQNNKVLKGSGGAVGLTHDPAALRRFTVGAPEVTRLLQEFNSEGDADDDDDQLEIHHEQTQSYQTRFLDMCIALRDGFYECESPFTVTGPALVVIDESRVVMQETAAAELMKAESRGRVLVKTFIEERLVNKTKSIYDPIKKCNLAIFSCLKKRTNLTPLVKTLKSEVQLYARLFIICTARNLDLKTFFDYENQSNPPSISLNGVIRSGVKAHLVAILEELLRLHEARSTPCSSEAMVFDGPVLVHSVQPLPTMKSFMEYAVSLAGHIRNAANKLGAKRVDVVWDMYSPSSLKGFTRAGRGVGVRRQDLPTKGKLPLNWKDYLRDDGNKTELFAFLAQKLISLLSDMHIVTNVGRRVESSAGVGIHLQHVDLEGLEEADGRVILHAMDMISCGVQKIVIRSNDADVLVLAISFCPTFKERGMKELWLVFGTGKHRRYLACHMMASTLGEKKAIALRCFHSFTGCDTVSFFASRGKRSAYSAWTTEDEIEAFYVLSHPVELPIPDDILLVLEKFVIKLYGIKDPQITTVNAARQYMFATLNRPVQSIPPSRGVFVKHVMRAAYQAGQVWGRAADGSKPPSPESWGWILQEGKYQPVWTDEPAIWAECRALDRCGCSTGCQTQRCKCRRFQLPCTPACKICKGTCCNKIATPTIADETEDVDGDLQE